MAISAFLDVKGSYQIEFPDYGVLDFRFSESRLVFLSLLGDEVDLGPHPVLATDPRVDVLMSQNKRWALIGPADGDYLYCWDASAMQMSAPIRLDRTHDDDAAFFRLQLVEQDTVILLIYENGLICFDKEVHERWRVTHRAYGWQFERILGDLIWYKNAQGDTWAYHLADGHKVTDDDDS